MKSHIDNDVTTTEKLFKLSLLLHVFLPFRIISLQLKVESFHENQSFVLPQVKTQSASRLPARMGDHALSNIRTRINRLSSVIAL